MKLLILAALIASAVAISGPAVNGTDGTRITHATNAYAGQFPWMVAVRHSQTFICGGALISPQWVLTSGECVWEYAGTEDKYTVFAGGLSILSAAEPGRIELRVGSVHPHPLFRTRDTLYYYNIGLMYLTTPVPPSVTIAIARFPIPNSYVPDGISLTLSGWGGTNSRKEDVTRVSPTLQYASMVTMPVDKCVDSVGGGATFNNGHICTYSYPDASACWYDHGGPLVQYEPSYGAVIRGVTAYAGCLDPSHPTIYTNPGYYEYSTWITATTGIAGVVV